jgi:hypothetical protein
VTQCFHGLDQLRAVVRHVGDSQGMQRPFGLAQRSAFADPRDQQERDGNFLGVQAPATVARRGPTEMPDPSGLEPGVIRGRLHGPMRL